MVKKLLEYNWKVFKHSLTTAKIVTLLAYSLFLLLIFANVFAVVFSIVWLKGSPELTEQYEWLTPMRIQFILLAFANLLWIAQFIFTNIRQLQLQENRKLLTVGYPVHRLARHLTLLSFFHPLNLLFNVTWIIFLYLLAPSALYLPLILAVVIFNYFAIYSLKFRYLKVIKDYFKWILLATLALLFIAGPELQNLMQASFWQSLEHYLTTINAAGSILPGSLIIHSVLIHSLPALFVLGATATIAGYLLLKDHYYNTKSGLQRPLEEEQHLSQGHLLERLCKLLGNHAGKYLYYVISHPYNRIQGAMFLVFPALYIPFAISDGDLSSTSNFFFFFFFIYPSLGFLLMFMGNLFGYENRELLLHMQLPVKLSDQIVQRFWGALILPLILLASVTVLELILFSGMENLITFVLGNIFIFLCFLILYIWSSFSQYKKIPWVSFSYTQPVISQSVAFGAGFLMLILAAMVFIPLGEAELYRQLFLILAILVMVFYLYRKMRKLKNLFENKIIPHLWAEL